MQFFWRILHVEGASPASLPSRASRSSCWYWQQRQSPWRGQHVASIVCQLCTERHRHDVPKCAAWCHCWRHSNCRNRRRWRRRCSWRRGSNCCCRCWWRSWGNAAGYFAEATRCGQIAHVQLSPQLGSAYDALQALRVSGTCSTWHAARSRESSCTLQVASSELQVASPLELL